MLLFLCVFDSKRGGNSISCTQIVEASSREHVSIQYAPAVLSFLAPANAEKQHLRTRYFNSQIVYLNAPFARSCIATVNDKIVLRNWKRKSRLWRVFPTTFPPYFKPPHRPGLLVLDNLMRNCSDDERSLDLFTKVSHHCDVTCIYLTQNLFPPGKFSRSISLNAHYIIAVNNP